MSTPMFSPDSTPQHPIQQLVWDPYKDKPIRASAFELVIRTRAHLLIGETEQFLKEQQS